MQCYPSHMDYARIYNSRPICASHIFTTPFYNHLQVPESCRDLDTSESQSQQCIGYTQGLDWSLGYEASLTVRILPGHQTHCIKKCCFERYQAILVVKPNQRSSSPCPSVTLSTMDQTGLQVAWLCSRQSKSCWAPNLLLVPSRVLKVVLGFIFMVLSLSKVLSSRAYLSTYWLQRFQ